MEPRAELVDAIRAILPTLNRPHGYKWWGNKLQTVLELRPSMDEIWTAMRYLFKRHETYYKPHCGWQQMPAALQKFNKSGDAL